jgi:hypothetical protein
MSKRLAGRIHIGRMFGHGVTHPVVIEIQDELSGAGICDIELTLEQYGDLVSGSGTVDCSMEVFESKHLGKKIESKSEFVPFDWTGWRNNKSELSNAAAKAAEPFLIDGWESYRESDFSNHHCTTEKNGVRGQNVVFWKYVEPDALRRA